MGLRRPRAAAQALAFRSRRVAGQRPAAALPRAADMLATSNIACRFSALPCWKLSQPRRRAARAAATRHLPTQPGIQPRGRPRCAQGSAPTRAASGNHGLRPEQGPCGTVQQRQCERRKKLNAPASSQPRPPKAERAPLRWRPRRAAARSQQRIPCQRGAPGESPRETRAARASNPLPAPPTPRLPRILFAPAGCQQQARVGFGGGRTLAVQAPQARAVSAGRVDGRAGRREGPSCSRLGGSVAVGSCRPGDRCTRRRRATTG